MVSSRLNPVLSPVSLRDLAVVAGRWPWIEHMLSRVSVWERVVVHHNFT